MRDTQRSAVYEAETLVRTMFDRADQRGLRSVEVMGSTITLPVERKFGSVESVQAYCDAFKGDPTKLASVDTTGEAADAYENLLDHQRKVGTPPDMPQETRQVFIDYMQSGADFVAALGKLPADSPITAMRTNKEFYDQWGGKLETPQELRDYSARNCT